MSDVIYIEYGVCLAFDYTNHRGETATRHVECGRTGATWRSTEWHPEPQWILSMFCLDRREWRDFAMKDMSNVRVIEVTSDE
jgi:hypothetical protein